MPEALVTQAITGGATPDTDTAAAIGKAVAKIDEIVGAMQEAKDTDTARWQTLDAERKEQTDKLQELYEAHGKAERDRATDEAITFAREQKARLQNVRGPSYAGAIGTGPSKARDNIVVPPGAFLYAVHEARSRDTERQAAGKAMLRALRGEDVSGVKAMLTDLDPIGKAVLDAGFAPLGPNVLEYLYQEGAPIAGKSTLGTTDAAGGWIIPNAIVDDIIKPARVSNIYRTLTTSRPGVTSPTVDAPFRSGLPARAQVVAFGQTKENVNLAYDGYTVTMYTIARIYDIGNQFLRQSAGAAEQDVLEELATGFALGEAYYIREGSGSSEPFGYTAALTNGPSAYRSTFTPSATTLAGSIATSIATAAGALAGRGQDSRDLSAVLAATTYWIMLSQGTDTAGFFFNPSGGPTAINAPAGTLISPFGIPVYPDATADVQNTAAVTDNLVVGNWKKFKVYYGQNYRVDSSDQAGTRWDTNLTGFRGEEEMGFDARPAVYSGNFQMITDVTP